MPARIPKLTRGDYSNVIYDQTFFNAQIFPDKTILIISRGIQGATIAILVFQLTFKRAYKLLRAPYKNGVHASEQLSIVRST